MSKETISQTEGLCKEVATCIRIAYDKGYKQGQKDGTKSEYEHDHAIIKAYNDGQIFILDVIRAEIEQNAYPIVHGVNNHEKGMTLYGILQIIDKYREVNK